MLKSVLRHTKGGLMDSSELLRAGLDTGSDHLLTAHQEDRGCPDLCDRISSQPPERVHPRCRSKRTMS